MRLHLDAFEWGQIDLELYHFVGEKIKLETFYNVVNGC